MTRLAENFSPVSLRRQAWPEEEAYGDLRRVLEELTTFKHEVIKAVNSIEHKRITTGSVAAAGTIVVSVAWDNKFKDTSYSVAFSVEDSSDSLEARSHKNKTATGVDVLVANNDGVGAHTGTLEAIAIHD